MVRFLFGGPEDTWICQNNQWVKHGNPDFPKPLRRCDEKTNLPKTRKDCLQRGGEWRKYGPHPLKECVLKASDAGRFCTDDDQCFGSCLAKILPSERREMMGGKSLKRNGTCSPTYNIIGCVAIVNQGTARLICLD